MYLNRRRFIWGNEREKLKISGIKGINSEKVNAIEEEAIYWRKENHIHKWFVENVQKGEDDCGTYDVSIEKLQELFEVVGKVLANNKLAGKLLPTQEGFFFGGTGYDNYYIEDLIHTHKELKKILDGGGDRWDYTYSSSW